MPLSYISHMCILSLTREGGRRPRRCAGEALSRVSTLSITHIINDDQHQH